HLVEPVPDPEGLRPGLTLAPPLRELLLRCLAKEASDRYADGRALVAALDALPDDAARFAPPTQRDRPTSRRSLAEAHGGPRAPKRRRSPWLGAAIVMGLAGLGGVGWVALERFTEPTEVAHAEPSGSTSPDSPNSTTSSTETEATSTTPPTRPADRVAAEDDDSGATDAVDAVATGLPEDRDPFATALPPELAELSHSLDAAPGDREVHRAMRVYQRLHPDDPRPSLLLARDFAKRGAWSQAFERYELALRRHPSARHDPQLLEDVLSAAQVEAQASTARDFVVRVFGVDARPRVRELLAQSEHRPTRVLLRALDAALGPEG
ncbi:MAG: hypothetical protein KC619_30420, partial [Myxococcales bacterium]|nr:hypothetical protein [Myxococcales bacterium]